MCNNVLSKKLKVLIALATLTSVCATVAVPVSATVRGNSEGVQVEDRATTNYRNVMYYGDWSIWGGEGNFYPKDMPLDKYTHLNLAFMDFDAQGNLKFCDPDAMIGHPLGNEGVTYGDINGGLINEFQVLRQKNPNLKIGISLGGWSKSNDFSVICRNEATLNKFVKNVMDFVRYANVDFVDIDWEYPNSKRDPDLVDNKNDEGTVHAGPDDKANYIKLLEKLRAALDEQGAELNKKYELSAALPMANSKVDDGIDVAKMFELLDFGNIMTYDAAGAWDEVSGHQTALYTNPDSPYKGKGFSVDESVKHYLSKGAPSEKVVIGAAYYTRGWEKINDNGPNSSLPGLYGTAERVNKDADNFVSFGAKNFAKIENGNGGRHGGVWPWRQQDALKQEYPGLKEYWDDSAKAPYLYSPSGAFFTYDNPRSIKEKTDYVKKYNLGGMIAWMASQDKETNSTKRDELTNATAEGLYGTNKLPTYEIVDNKADAAVKLTANKPQWGSGGSVTVNLNNTGKLTTTGGPDLLKTEESAKTLKNISMYIKTNNGVTITGADSPAPAPVLVDGYYKIDFSGVYDAKLIKPGASLKFDIKTSKELDSTLNGIEEIYITQRMHKNAPEFGKTVLFTGAEGTYDAEDVNKDGTVDVKDLTEVASRYNKKTGETGYDVKYDIVKDSIIDLFDLTKVSKKIETTTDGGGGEVTPPEPGDVKPFDENGTYAVGDLVLFNGKVYKCLVAYSNNPWWSPDKALGVIWIEV